jgi:hypothetical protein
VAPTLESSLTGSGTTGYPVPSDTPFGNTDFRVYNVDFVNEWSDYSDGPAHALSLSRANGGFYYCGFFSYQDTVSLLYFLFLFLVMGSSSDSALDWINHLQYIRTYPLQAKRNRNPNPNPNPNQTLTPTLTSMKP